MKRVAALLGLWLAAQVLWLLADGALRDGDAMGHVGTVEELVGISRSDGIAAMVRRAFVEDWGEYPPLFPLVTALLVRLTGGIDLDGDGPELLTLPWGALTVISTALWVRGPVPRQESSTPDPAVYAALPLICSPLFSGVTRLVMPEGASLALCVTAAASWRFERPLLTGVFMALALLTKQTALIFLLPFALGSLRGRRGLLSLAVTAAVAGPWYLPRLGQIGAYLWTSASSNPDQSSALHQAAYYPLLVLQQGWAPLSCGVLAGLLVFTRRPTATGTQARGAPGIAGLTGILLLLLPKKYARLALPLLPWCACYFGCQLARLGPRARLAAVLGLGVPAVVSWGLGPPALGATSLGLDGLDERCNQPAVRPPTRPPFPREALLATLPLDRPLFVGGSPWPASPCEWQTTHDLGEQLAVWLRRRGSPLRRVDEGGIPDLTVTDGPFRCEAHPEWCAGRGLPRETATVRYDHPDWPLDLRVSTW